MNDKSFKAEAELNSYEKENEKLFETLQNLVLAIEEGRGGAYLAIFLEADRARKKFSGLPSAKQVWEKYKKDVLNRELP